MKVSELGEFGLIGLIAETVRKGSAGSPPGLLLGIGDDAAAWRSRAGVHLATTDTMVDGVHFNRGQITWEELGWKSLAVNLSDIAAMGGVPQYALVTLGVPGDTDAGNVVSLYRGMLAAGNPFQVAIAGGDTIRSPLIVITICLFGSIKGTKGRMMTRGGARAGDLVNVTGFLGTSAGGLRMLEHSLVFDREVAMCLRQAHFRPQPRVFEGQKMVRAGVRCAIDVSDGLIADLTHVCDSSRVGATINVDAVPVHPVLRAAFPDEYLEMALSGGEDYELLFTASPETLAKLRPLISIPLTTIGEITAEDPGRVALVDKEGKSFVESKSGWDHFAAASG